ncbi:hypothetical protein R1flu_020163 [Riccia fluitans]|uniref:Inositol-phosphate phosphatase n=1 Tax=Riccia fluitans TaxID=41844 RepID=A0ABD1ZKR1_9MARC
MTILLPHREKRASVFRGAFRFRFSLSFVSHTHILGFSSLTRRERYSPQSSRNREKSDIETGDYQFVALASWFFAPEPPLSSGRVFLSFRKPSGALEFTHNNTKNWLISSKLVAVGGTSEKDLRRAEEEEMLHSVRMGVRCTTELHAWSLAPPKFGVSKISTRGLKRNSHGTRSGKAQAPCGAVRSGQSRSPEFETVATQAETLALKLAKEAGALIREKSGRALQVDTKVVRYDLVTEVDRACERLIQTEVQAVFPSHDWIGEETAAVDDLRKLERDFSPSRWTWIVDPIDGTLSFVDGVPLSVVSIGIAFEKSMEIGVIYNPYYDELFHARRGRGSYLNGKPIRVLPPETELEDTTVTFGIPSKSDKRAAMIDDVAKVALHCRSLKALGSAALHMSYVAAGRFGCFFENDLKPWDIAAGLLIIEEARGRVSDLEGKPVTWNGGRILASNGGIIHNRMLELLKQSGTLSI